MTDRFSVAWTLRVEDTDGGVLAQALEPEMGGHATLETEEGALVVRGKGSAGESLHTLDDVLACLTGAVGAVGGGGVS